MQLASEGPLKIFKWQGTLGNALKFQDSPVVSFAILIGCKDFWALFPPPFYEEEES